MNEIIGIIGLIGVFVLLFLRMPVAFAFGVAGLCGIYCIQGFQKAMVCLYTVPYHFLSSSVWSTIPLFVLMGYFASNSKLTEDFYTGIRAWIGHVRGGLIYAIILGNAAFGACCGVSIAAATSFASISLPEARKAGYSDTLVLGSIAGSSNLSILIPPSFGFIIMGVITETSIGKLFIGGIVPGIVLTVMFIIVTVIIVWRNPKVAPTTPIAAWTEKKRGLLGMSPLVVVFVIIIGGLYLGLFTPVESAGVATMVVLLLGLARRRFTWAGIIDSLSETIMLSSMVFVLIIGTSIFNTFLGLSGATKLLSNSMGFISGSAIIYLVSISVIFLILGMFLDVMPLTLLAIPIIYPISLALNIHPVHFGVVFVTVSAIGTISPPFGIVTFSLARVCPEIPLFDIFRGTYPYMWAMVLLVCMLIFIPQISTLLPDLMLGS